MTTLVRGQVVGLAVAFMTLAGCQCSTDYGNRCNFHRADGGLILESEVTPGADLIDTTATECAKEVCFRQGDAGQGPANEPAVGYCTGECVSDCPASVGGAAGTCTEVVASGVPGLPQGVKYCAYPFTP